MAPSPGGFPWTVHISPENQAAVAWIEANLPENAIVQIDANARGRSTWVLIPAFAAVAYEYCRTFGITAEMRTTLRAAGGSS